MKTLQEIFVKVATHMVTQNRQSIKDYSCRYRGPEGMSCAVGCLITDEHYEPELEGLVVNNEDVKRAVLNSIGYDQPSADLIELLDKLQSIHDSISPETMGDDAWRERLIHLGKSRGLDTAFLEKAP